MFIINISYIKIKIYRFYYNKNKLNKDNFSLVLIYIMLPSIIFFIIFVYVLFVALTPGVLFTLPPNSSHIIVALVHGLIFIIAGVLTTILIAKFSNRRGLCYKPEPHWGVNQYLIDEGLRHGLPSPSQFKNMKDIQKQEYDLRKKVAEEDKISNEAKIKQLNEAIKYYDDMKKKEMSNTTSVVKGSRLNANDYDLKIQQAEKDISVYINMIQKDDRIINQPFQVHYRMY